MATKWFSKRAVLLHLIVVVWVPGCFVAAWWQVTVAMAGDDLGYLYSVEWPIFAIFGVVAWWHFIHDDPETHGAKGLRRARQMAEERGGGKTSEPVRRYEEEDEELAAYNDYLESLAGKAKTWRRV